MSALKRTYLLFYLAGLAVIALAGWLQRAPGYMDADYYYAGGLVLLKGGGFSQPFLWNYLDAPAGLPVPGFTYWMPLGSLLAAAGAALGGGFLTARLTFWLLGAAVPPLTVWAGIQLHGERGKALLGGLFALFPVYYLSYLPTTDVFAATMLLGTGLIFILRRESVSLSHWFLCGLLAGLMHLARADGIFWLAGVLAAACLPLLASRPKAEQWLQSAAACLAALAGYFLPMSFWYLRNLGQWSWIFAPGSGRTLWLTRYEDTFLYPAGLLDARRWLATGAAAILAARGAALGTNLQTWVAVQGGVVLLPFALGGLWLLRRLQSVRFAVLMWLATFAAMTLVFPYAGINGSFFHSGAAFQPLIWAAAPLGLERFVAWLARLRGWQRGEQVRRFFAGLLLAACVGLTLLIYVQRTAGGAVGAGLAWDRSDRHYRAVEQRLVELGATPCLVVMVNNPPGYYAAAGRSGVVIPYGDEAVLFSAARQYDASYLVLEENDAGHLPELYDRPGDRPGLAYLGEVEGTKLYAFTNNP
jgi:hypothetical protein